MLCKSFIRFAYRVLTRFQLFHIHMRMHLLNLVLVVGKAKVVRPSTDIPLKTLFSVFIFPAITTAGQFPYLNLHFLECFSMEGVLEFVVSFLQIPHRYGHPCSWLMISTIRVHSGLATYSVRPCWAYKKRGSYSRKTSPLKQP